MGFKEWLIKEDFGATDSDLTGDAMYPTNAGDYAYAANNPVEHSWLQWKWDQEKKQGRKFHNIDQKEFEKRGYATLHSITMPDKEWKHSSDKRPNMKLEKISDLDLIGIGKKSSDKPTLGAKAMVQWYYPLDKMFGDKGSGNWPEAAVDKEWKENITPYIDVSGKPVANVNMGVPSKYVGPDETGEKEDGEKPKIADFGFEKPIERLKKKLAKHKYSNPLEVKHVQS